MGKRKYYCDYCNRSFNDDKGARSRHLQSAAHLKNKELHYDTIKQQEYFESATNQFGENYFTWSHALPASYYPYFPLPPSLQPYLVSHSLSTKSETWG